MVHLSQISVFNGYLISVCSSLEANFTCVKCFRVFGQACYIDYHGTIDKSKWTNAVWLVHMPTRTHLLVWNLRLSVSTINFKIFEPVTNPVAGVLRTDASNEMKITKLNCLFHSFVSWHSWFRIYSCFLKLISVWNFINDVLFSE